MRCNTIQSRLSTYADGELSRVAAWQVRRHLRACPDCAALLADLEVLSSAAASLYANAPVPASLRTRFLAESATSPSDNNALTVPAKEPRATKRSVVFAPALIMLALFGLGGAALYAFLQPTPADFSALLHRNLLTELFQGDSMKNDTFTPRFAVAPDGKSIIFTGNGRDDLDLYRLDLQTKRVTRLTNTPEREDAPASSSDGRKIVFSVQSGGIKNPSHLFLCRDDGSHRTQITNSSSSDYASCFSQRGDFVAFTRAALLRPYSMGGWVWDDWDLWVARPDGSQARQVTREKYRQIYAPSVAPDGKTILFSAEVHGDEDEAIFVVSVNGSAPPRVLPHVGRSSEGGFSSDGRQIIFVSDRAKAYDYEVWIMDADGGLPAQITQMHSYIICPRFLPDGKSILFLSAPRRDRRFDLMQIDRDGTHLRKLADSRLFTDPLRWKP